MDFRTLIIAVVIILVIIYIVSYVYNSPIENDGTLTTMVTNMNSAYNDDKVGNVAIDETIATDESESESGSRYASYAMPSDDSSSDSETAIRLKRRMMGRNNVNLCGKKPHVYKAYSTLNSGPDPEDEFSIHDISKNYTDRFVPIDESCGIGSPISIKMKNGKETVEDEFDVEQLLPQAQENAWFDTMDSIEINNGNLISTDRPIGVNTIGSSNAAGTWDIRGLDGCVNPKMVVSPWLQSSYEPNRTNKSLC